ncbi:MAG: hypothetical protein IKS71_05785 [Bacteroidales bacterium]|nr:hypothetical protein [Bacteroidales bacterium]
MLRIGKILKSNGTDGGLLVSAPEVELEQIEGPVYVEFDGLPAPFFFDDCIARGTSRYIVHMTGVRSLKDAEEMVGRDILFDGEFEEEGSSEDFVGWKVFDEDYEVGVVEDYEPIPGNFCLYVRTTAGEQVMIPLHEDFIISADSATRKLILRLPDGLY